MVRVLPVRGFGRHYLVFSNGMVASRQRRVVQSNGVVKTYAPRFLRGHTGKKGYTYVVLTDSKGEHFQRPVHQLVCRAFRGPSRGLEPNHRNGVKCDNRASNLEWKTHRENINHAYRNGLSQSGERHYAAKLTCQQVRSIRRLSRKSIPHHKIANRFGVNRSCVSQIIRGVTWKHL